MIEHNIDIQTKDGSMNTFITHPEESGPFPVILFLMDAPGKREELHDMARRLGSVGYYVILPNLYYRQTRDFVLDFNSDKSRERMRELMYSLSNRMVIEDCQALIEYAEKDDFANCQHIGTVGYCMSGPFAICVAGAMPSRIQAAASIHGVALVTDSDMSPHRMAEQAKAELYFACAETDEYAPVTMVDELQNHLDKIETKSRIEWYPKTEHGFVFPQRVKYEKHSAERHWERLFDLFKRNLS